MVNSVAVKAIDLAVDAQYVEELKEEYVGYANQTINTMFTQIYTWYVITTKDNLDIKALFLAPWSDTPEAHIITIVFLLYRSQVKCEDHGVTITNDNKLDNFVSQMFACGLF